MKNLKYYTLTLSILILVVILSIFLYARFYLGSKIESLGETIIVESMELKVQYLQKQLDLYNSAILIIKFGLPVVAILFGVGIIYDFIFERKK